MARHVPSLPRRRRAVSAVLAGAAALGAVALVPGVATAAPVPTAPARTAPKADLSVTIDEANDIPRGDESTVVVTITNRGPVAADRVRTQVQLPPGVASNDEIGPSNPQSYNDHNVRFDEPTSLASGESRTYTLFVSTTRERATTGTVSAQVRSTTLDPAMRNNRATAAIRALGGPYDD